MNGDPEPAGESYSTDVVGRRYLDAGSSLFACTIGNAHPGLREAAQTHLETLGTPGGERAGSAAATGFAHALGAVVPVRSPQVLFTADGAAAVARGVDAAVRQHRAQPRTRPPALLALRGAAHVLVGRGFEIIHAPGYRDPNWLAETLARLDRIADRLAGVVIEPLVQTAAGVAVAEPAGVARLADAVQGRGIALICDEVATGFGRTGTLFAAEQCLITPDVLCLGSSLTSGHLPLGATVLAAHLSAGPDRADEQTRHHSLGIGLAAAVAQRHLRLVTAGELLDRVAVMGELLGAALAPFGAHPVVRQLRRKGLLAALELDPPERSAGLARAVQRAALVRGVRVEVASGAIVVAPALTITRQEIAAIAGALGGALDQAHREPNLADI